MLRGLLSWSGGGTLIKGSSQQRGLRRQSVSPRLRRRQRLDFPVPKFGRRLVPCQSTHELTVLTVVDPHVTSLSGERFDLWKTGWSKFVQIYLTEPRGCELQARRVEELRQYLIGDHFALSHSQDVSLSGPWLERDCFLMRAVFSKVWSLAVGVCGVLRLPSRVASTVRRSSDRGQLRGIYIGGRTHPCTSWLRWPARSAKGFI